MSDEAAFLRAIRESPDDDAPRLVFADWLEERGRAERAELIRVQCELAAGGEGHPRRDELRERERGLLAAHEAEWAGDVPTGVEDFEFRRGFVDSVSVAAGWVGEAVGGLSDHWVARRLCVVRGVRLPLMSLHPNGFACLDALPTLRELDVGGWGFDRGHLESLRATGVLGRLTSLTLVDHRLDAGGVAVVADGAAALRFLDLSHGHAVGTRVGLTDQGAAALARLAGLGELRLRWNRMSALGLRALADGPSGVGLCALSLSGNLSLTETVEAAGHFPCLSDLSLSLSRTDLRRFPQVTGRRGWSSVTALQLPPGDLPVSAWNELLAAPPPQLHTLTLSARLTSVAWESLARSDLPARLRHLQVSPWGEYGGEGLTAAGPWPLRSFTLHDAQADPARFVAWVTSGALPELESLDLSGNAVGSDGLLMLAEHCHRYPRLARLDLADCSVGNPGLRALAGSPLLSRLDALNLGGANRFDESALLALADSLFLGPLTRLTLDAEAVTGRVRQRFRERLGRRFHG